VLCGVHRLRWDAVDLATRTARVLRVAGEVSGHVTGQPYPKSRAGRRIVPLPGFVIELLTEHKHRYLPSASSVVFTSRSGAAE
jgi:hypothetical protein